MLFPKSLFLLAVLCLGSLPGHAQQAAPLPGYPLLTAPDTVQALHHLFEEKRRSSGFFLAATPVAAGVTTVAIAYVGLKSLSNTNPKIVPPLLTLGVGVGGTVALLRRYTRYTKGSEQELRHTYESTHRLPKWARRRLQEQAIRANRSR